MINENVQNELRNQNTEKQNEKRNQSSFENAFYHLQSGGIVAENFFFSVLHFFGGFGRMTKNTAVAGERGFYDL